MGRQLRSRPFGNVQGIEMLLRDQAGHYYLYRLLALLDIDTPRERHARRQARIHRISLVGAIQWAVVRTADRHDLRREATRALRRSQLVERTGHTLTINLTGRQLGMLTQAAKYDEHTVEEAVEEELCEFVVMVLRDCYGHDETKAYEGWHRVDETDAPRGRWRSRVELDVRLDPEATALVKQYHTTSPLDYSTDDIASGSVVCLLTMAFDNQKEAERMTGLDSAEFHDGEWGIAERAFYQAQNRRHERADSDIARPAAAPGRTVHVMTPGEAQPWAEINLSLEDTTLIQERADALEVGFDAAFVDVLKKGLADWAEKNLPRPAHHSGRHHILFSVSLSPEQMHGGVLVNLSSGTKPGMPTVTVPMPQEGHPILMIDGKSSEKFAQAVASLAQPEAAAAMVDADSAVIRLDEEAAGLVQRYLKRTNEPSPSDVVSGCVRHALSLAFAGLSDMENNFNYEMYDQWYVPLNAQILAAIHGPKGTTDQSTNTPAQRSGRRHDTANPADIALLAAAEPEPVEDLPPEQRTPAPSNLPDLDNQPDFDLGAEDEDDDAPMVIVDPPPPPADAKENDGEEGK